MRTWHRAFFVIVEARQAGFGYNLLTKESLISHLLRGCLIRRRFSDEIIR
jgi:hypothetical protein